jgi:hypothetical protein
MSVKSRTRRNVTKSASLLLGAALAVGVGCTPSSASATTAAHSFTLDGVALQVSTPDYPTGSLYTTPSGGLVQVASLSDNAPFRYLSVTAVPYGETLPESKFPESKSGNAANWRKAQGGSAGPLATLFGQKVAGQITHSQMPGADGATQKTIETITWIVESGNRTWVVTMQHDESSLPAAFGGGMTISSPNTAAATSVNLKAAKSAPHASTGAVNPVQNHALAMAAAPSGNLGRPSWWGANCDGYSNLLNTTFMGLQVCGYPTSDKLESGIPGVGQYEFECAELSDRYLVQRYGINGAGGNGNQVVDNFYNSYSSRFQRFANGSHTPPVAGDVVSYSVGGSGFGHTGVVIASNVNSSGNGTISMVHENWNENASTPGEWDNIPVSNWNVTEVTGQGGTVEWLHNPADGTQTPPAGFNVGIDANGASATNAQSVTGTVNLTAMASAQGYINSLYYTITGAGGYSKTIPGGGGASNYAQTWNTVGLPGGSYSISVTANETDGQNHTYGPVPFFVHPTNSRSTVIAPNRHLYVFSRGTDNTLRMTSSDMGAVGWIDMAANLGGSIQGEPAVTMAPNGHMYIFARGADNTLRMWSSDMGAVGWIDNGVSLGGSIATDPAVTIAPNGHMYIFAGGTDSSMHMWSSDLGAVGWLDTNANVNGSVASNPSVTIGSNGVMYVFAGGTDRTLRMWSSDLGAVGWHDQGTSLGGSIGGPAEAVADNNHLYIFAASTDNTLRMWSSDLLGTGWVDQNANLGGAITADPSVTIAPNGHMYIFARSTGNRLQMWSSDMGAVGWLDMGADLGGSIEGIPAALIGPNGHLYIFAGGTDATLRMWSSDLGAVGWLDTNADVVGGVWA